MEHDDKASVRDKRELGEMATNHLSTASIEFNDKAWDCLKKRAVNGNAFDLDKICLRIDALDEKIEYLKNKRISINTHLQEIDSLLNEDINSVS